MWKGCSTTARTCDSARSTGSANSRRAWGSALMMLRLIAMFHDTSRSASSGRLSAPVSCISHPCAKFAQKEQWAREQQSRGRSDKGENAMDLGLQDKHAIVT